MPRRGVIGATLLGLVVASIAVAGVATGALGGTATLAALVHPVLAWGAALPEPILAAVLLLGAAGTTLTARRRSRDETVTA